MNIIYNPRCSASVPTQTKPAKQDLSNQTCKTKPTKSNIPNQTYQTKANLPKQTYQRDIPSEKIGRNFWPPWNGFFGIDYHYWTWGNAFWPFLAPPDPWGVSGGVWGVQGGSLGPKIVTFLGATFGFQIGNFWIVWTKNTLFSRFLAKMAPQETKNGRFGLKLVKIKVHFSQKHPL